jgi:hypothetical protein
MRRARILGVLMLAHACGCGVQNGITGTIDPGDNLIAPDLALDDDFFYCKIEPLVIQQKSCANGASGEQGRCHDSRSALRLMASDASAPCNAAGRVTGTLPDAYIANLDAVRFFVQSDPLTSPLYLRPLNLASHPRRIFDDKDPAAKLIEEWISAGAN